MTLHASLLDVICCPLCKGDLQWQEPHADLAEGGFHCNACALTFPIKEGLPRLLRDEAQAD